VYDVKEVVIGLVPDGDGGFTYVIETDEHFRDSMYR